MEMALLMETGRRRVMVQNVAPEIEAGEFPIKRIVGQRVMVSADALTDGHDQLSCVLKYRKAEQPAWSEVAHGADGQRPLAGGVSRAGERPLSLHDRGLGGSFQVVAGGLAESAVEAGQER